MRDQRREDSWGTKKYQGGKGIEGGMDAEIEGCQKDTMQKRKTGWKQQNFFNSLKLLKCACSHNKTQFC